MKRIWNVSKFIFRRVAFCLVLAFTVSATAQTKQDDKAAILSFVNSVAKSIYNLAWPTAKYQSVSLDDLERAPGGYDVTVKLSGLSGIDGSDLWVRLVIMIRNGNIYDLRVRDDNHILFAPFETMKNAGQLLAELGREYQAERSNPPANPARPPAPAITTAGPTVDTVTRTQIAQRAAATCITNPTQNSIVFTYRWGESSWKEVRLAPGDGLSMWLPGNNDSTRLSVRYDGDYAPGFQEQIYDLQVTNSTIPIICDSVAKYKFALQGTRVLVYKVDPVFEGSR